MTNRGKTPSSWRRSNGSTVSPARDGPDCGPLITTAPQSATGLEGEIGIWCPLSQQYDDRIADEHRRHGEEVWWYVCCGPTAPWANFFLNQPGPSHRLLLWQMFQHRTDGLLYWGVNHWPAFADRTMVPSSPDRRWPSVPWIDAGRDGDGYLLYPGPDGPLSSLRLEILRDGVEDYDALRLLEDLVRQLGTRAPAELSKRAASALTIDRSISDSLTSVPADAMGMVRRREEVNELIVLYQGLIGR